MSKLSVPVQKLRSLLEEIAMDNFQPDLPPGTQWDTLDTRRSGTTVLGAATVGVSDNVMEPDPRTDTGGTSDSESAGELAGHAVFDISDDRTLASLATAEGTPMAAAWAAATKAS